MNSLPSRSRMVGVIEESGRLPGWMALASPWIRPNIFSVTGLGGEIVHFVVEQKAEARERSRRCR